MNCVRCESANYVQEFISPVLPLFEASTDGSISFDFQRISLCRTCAALLKRKTTAIIEDIDIEQQVYVPFKPTPPPVPPEPPKSGLLDTLLASLATATEDQRKALVRLLGPIAMLRPEPDSPPITTVWSEVGPFYANYPLPDSQFGTVPNPDCKAVSSEWNDFGPFDVKVADAPDGKYAPGTAAVIEAMRRAHKLGSDAETEKSPDVWVPPERHLTRETTAHFHYDPPKLPEKNAPRQPPSGAQYHQYKQEQQKSKKFEDPAY